MPIPWLALSAASAAASYGNSMLGQKPQGTSQGDLEFMIAERRRGIDAFETKLADARATFEARSRNLQAKAFERFTPELEAGLASRGLQVSGGAFGSGAGRAAAELEAQLGRELSTREREDLLQVENLRANMFSSSFGAASKNAAQTSADRAARARSQQEAIGTLGGALTSHFLDRDFLDAQVKAGAFNPRAKRRSVVAGGTSNIDPNIDPRLQHGG